MSKKALGRPASAAGKRGKKIDVRFTEAEYAKIVALEKELGIGRAELIRQRLLNQYGRVVVNAKSLLSEMDKIGAELGRAGNNINQLAHHANTLHLKGALDQHTINSFNQQMDTYFQLLGKLDVTMRKILREMSNRDQ